MEKQQKNKIKKYISWGLIVVLVALLSVMPLLTAGDEGSEEPQASILSGNAERNDISKQLIGGGILTSEDAVEITIPATVKLTEYLVKNGDTVEEGQEIAAVDRISVMTAITQVQETLDHLAEKIEAIRDEKSTGEVVTQAGGTVKILYAKEGESVQDVMLRDRALAVLSLDGLMAVQVERNTDLAAGDAVCVTLYDGTEAEGRVESNLDGILTVTIEDDGYSVGEEATVATEDGVRIGSGALYIHSQWNAVAYSGTVSKIRVKEGDAVTAGRTLMNLKDIGHTNEYYQLADQHREYEALMLSLFRMYQSESITAPRAGMISGVDEAGTFMLCDDGTGWQITFLTNAPNSDDESTYANFVGQVSEVGIGGLIMKMNPQQLSITDYKDLSGIPTDTALMTENAIYNAQAPVYELMGGVWVQIDVSAIIPGDVLLFAGDANGNFVWVIRIGRGSAVPDVPDDTDPTDPTTPTEPENPTEPTQPGDPEQPTEPSDPTTPTNPSTPTKPNRPGAGFPHGGGSGFAGGGMQQEEQFELYGLETVTVAAVTSQEKMTVEITVDELDITKIFLGQSADVTLDALPGEKFTATVTRIANSGENNGGSSKFTVQLLLEKRGDMLPGMSTSVVLTLDTVRDCICVPVAALTETGTETTLYTSYDEETGAFGDRVTVTVGVSDGEMAEILSGIDVGTTYYYPYYDTPVIPDAPDVGGGFPFG